MNKIKINKIAKDLNVTHSAVSQWFSGKSIPSIEKVINMNELHKIAFTAWKDIKSFINESITSIQNNKQLLAKKETE